MMIPMWVTSSPWTDRLTMTDGLRMADGLTMRDGLMITVGDENNTKVYEERHWT